MQIDNFGRLAEEYEILINSFKHPNFKYISLFISKVDGEKNEIIVKKQNLVVHLMLRLGFTVYHDRPNLSDFNQGVSHNSHSIKDGTHVPEFMHKVQICDYFVALYTEEYKKRSELDSYKLGGVRCEIDLCRARLEKGEDILIGLCLDGNINESIPYDLSKRLYRESSCMEEIFASTLYIFLDSILPNINISGFDKNFCFEQINTFLKKWFPSSRSYSKLNDKQTYMTRGIERKTLEEDILNIIKRNKVPVVVGPAGSGKTVISKRVAFKLAEKETYEINCSSDVQISLGLKMFAQYLQGITGEILPPIEAENIEYIKYITDILRKKSSPTVIILDDFSCPHLFLDLNFENVSFIITSRDENYDQFSQFEFVRMKELDDEEKLKLFYSEYPTQINQAEEESAFLEKISPYPLDVVTAARYKMMHINNDFQSIVSKVKNRESLLREILSTMKNNHFLPIIFLIKNKNISLIILEKYSSLIESTDSFYSLIWQLKRYSIMYESENSLHIHDEIQKIGLSCIFETYSLDKLTENLKCIIKHTIDHPLEFDLKNRMLDFCLNLECMLKNLGKIKGDKPKIDKLNELLLHNITYSYFILRLYKNCYHTFERLMQNFPSSNLSLVNNFATVGIVVRNKNAEKFTNDFLIEGDKRNLFNGEYGLLMKIKLMIATLYHTMYFDKTYLQIKNTENKFDEIGQLIDKFIFEDPKKEDAIFNLDRVKYYFYSLVFINGKKLECWMADAKKKIDNNVSRLNEYTFFSIMMEFRLGNLLSDKEKRAKNFEIISKDPYFKNLVDSIKLNNDIQEVDELNDKARHLEDEILKKCTYFSKSINKTGIESLRLTLYYSDLMFRTNQIEKGIDFLILQTQDILEKVESRKLSNYNMLQCSQFFYDGYMFFLLSKNKNKSLAWFYCFIKLMDHLCQSYYDIHEKSAEYENLKIEGNLYAEKSLDYDDIFKNLENRNKKAYKLFSIFFGENHEYINNHIKRSILAEERNQELPIKKRRICSVNKNQKSVPYQKIYSKDIKENRMYIEYVCKKCTFYIDARMPDKIDIKLSSEKIILRSMPYDEQSKNEIKKLFYELRTCPVASLNYGNGPLEKIEDIESQQISCLKFVQEKSVEIEESLKILRELEKKRSNVQSTIDNNIKIHEIEREKLGLSFVIYSANLIPIGFVRTGIIEVDVNEAMIVLFPKLENISKILSFDPAIMLLKEYQERGLGSEITCFVMDTLLPLYWTLNIDGRFEPVRYLYATASDSNEKSIALIKKLGGVFTKNDGTKNHYLAQLDQKKIELSSINIRQM